MMTSCREVSVVSRVDGMMVSIDVVQLPSLRRVSISALHPLVVLVPKAGRDM